MPNIEQSPFGTKPAQLYRLSNEAGMVVTLTNFGARIVEILLPARSVTTRMFTAEEDCAAHCQVGDMALAVRTILAWEESLRTGTR